MWLKKAIKSKTIRVNALIAAIGAVLSAVGVEIPQDVIIAVTTIANVFLRSITNEPLSAK